MIDKSIELKEGMEVAYTSGYHGDYQHNPLWGGDYGYIAGKITKIKVYGGTLISIHVYFDRLGTSNSYKRKDLTLIEDIIGTEEEVEKVVKGVFNI